MSGPGATLAIARGGACANGATCLHRIAEYRLYGFHRTFFVNATGTGDPNGTERTAVLDDWKAARLGKIAEPNVFGIALSHQLHELRRGATPARGRDGLKLGGFWRRG